jgi:hypothetical protein
MKGSGASSLAPAEWKKVGQELKRTEAASSSGDSSEKEREARRARRYADESSDEDYQDDPPEYSCRYEMSERAARE